MEPARAFLLCCCVWHFCSGRTLQPKDSPPQSDLDPVFAVVHTDAVLPCRSAGPIQLSQVAWQEWLRVYAPFNLTVHAMRNGKQLEKEKAPEYMGRTALLADGSLKLRVNLNDTGSYICVLEGSPVGTEVSLIVGEVLEFDISVRRSSANELFVACESSVRNLQPNVSLLDADGKAINAETKRTVMQRSLHSVTVSVKVDAAEGKLKGNGTFICRLEIPKAKLVEEKRIRVTDDFIPSKDASFPFLLLLLSVFMVVVIMVVVLWMNEELRFKVADIYSGKMAAWWAGEEGEPLLGDVDYTDDEDLSQIATSGASETTVMINELEPRNGVGMTGVEASNILADQDLNAMSNYKEKIVNVGKKHHIWPSLIAAIISKQSRGGTILKSNGYGKFDNNCFGLLQINKTFHATSGTPFSHEHINDGTKYLVHLIKTLKQSEANWNRVQHLKGALISYISGIDKVKATTAGAANVDLVLEGLDKDTPTKDFASDVFARAKRFANHGYTL